jgi:hypothetical protein
MGRGGKCGVRSAECGVRSAECGARKVDGILSLATPAGVAEISRGLRVRQHPTPPDAERGRWMGIHSEEWGVGQGEMRSAETEIPRNLNLNRTSLVHLQGMTSAHQKHCLNRMRPVGRSRGHGRFLPSWHGRPRPCFGDRHPLFPRDTGWSPKGTNIIAWDRRAPARLYGECTSSACLS